MSVTGISERNHENPGILRLLAGAAYAMLVKEFIQLRRDRVSFGNDRDDTGDAASAVRLRQSTPRRAICRPRYLLQEDSDHLARSILKALENTAYFHFPPRSPRCRPSFDNLLQSGKVLFGIEIPRGFERRSAAVATSRRCWSPPTPPIRSQRALRLATLGGVVADRAGA